MASYTSSRVFSFQESSSVKFACHPHALHWQVQVATYVLLLKNLKMGGTVLVPSGWAAGLVASTLLLWTRNSNMRTDSRFLKYLPPVALITRLRFIDFFFACVCIRLALRRGLREVSLSRTRRGNSALYAFSLGNGAMSLPPTSGQTIILTISS